MTTTVFTLAGGFSPHDITSLLRGTVTAGRTVQPIFYNNFTVPQSPDFYAAVDMLDDAITSTADTKVVFGASLGAVVASRWLRDRGPTSAVDPADLSFVFAGNSVSRRGGYLPLINLYTACVPPLDCRYPTRDFKRQYDGWTDYPNLLKPNSTAIQNALQGQSIVHVDYTKVAPGDVGNVSYTEGNITYEWAPTYPVPMVAAFDAASFWAPLFGAAAVEKQRARIFAEDQRYRPVIELGYDRPVTIPDP